MRRACRSVDHRANNNNDGRQSHLRVHSKQIFFISSRTNGKKRRENTERRAERGAQKKTERVGRTHLTSPVYTQFRRFRRAKKEEDLASSFLVVFGFLPPEFLRHSLPAIFIDRDACVAKIFRSGERNKKKHQKRKKQNLSFLTSV